MQDGTMDFGTIGDHPTSKPLTPLSPAELAHEIRNPLHAIRLNLHTLRIVQQGKCKLNAEDIESLLQQSERSIDTVDALVQDLLDLARGRASE